MKKLSVYNKQKLLTLIIWLLKTINRGNYNIN